MGVLQQIYFSTLKVVQRDITSHKNAHVLHKRMTQGRFLDEGASVFLRKSVFFFSFIVLLTFFAPQCMKMILNL